MYHLCYHSGNLSQFLQMSWSFYRSLRYQACIIFTNVFLPWCIIYPAFYEQTDIIFYNYFDFFYRFVYHSFIWCIFYYIGLIDIAFYELCGHPFCKDYFVKATLWLLYCFFIIIYMSVNEYLKLIVNNYSIIKFTLIFILVCHYL